MEEKELAELVRDVVLRLLPATITNQSPEYAEKAYKYASRILSSRMTPSIAADEAAMAESIKRQLVLEGRSSDALAFADLYSKFSSKSGPGTISNKWSVLYLLKVISQDQSKDKLESRVRVSLSPSCIASASNGGLPAIFGNENSVKRDHYENSKFVTRDRERVSDREKVSSTGGVLLLSKDPENIRQAAFREFSVLLRDETEVSESALVKDIIYACQGIDGRYVRFDIESDGYVLPESIRVPRATRVLVMKLCELGWLFRKVRGYISDSMEKFPADEIGTVGQAFCAALHDELSDYYRLLAVLETQSLNPIPLVSESSSGNYLSLRRLSVWLTEPTTRMRLMAVLVDNSRVLRGGAMAGAIHVHAQHGDPLFQEFMVRLLRRVCSPLFEMVRTWVLEGELNDIYGEFFIVSQTVKAESLWRDRYQVNASMLPGFISEHLAQRILRTGKSINFLRVCCEDQDWAGAPLVGATTRRGELGYGETEALEALVIEAAKRIDKHLIDVMCKKFKFKEHCLAIKRYLLLGQGDFIQYLMDIVGPELSEPANTISSFKLAGLLESAIRASNAQYDDPDILDRLRVKMMPHGSGDRGWDVFSLEYNTRVPLDTVFTEFVMAKYLRIFNFLWKLRRVEHALIGAWKVMKPNCAISQLLSMDAGVKVRFVAILRRCQVLWDEMNHFVTNLQYYIMFEVLEVSWSCFLEEMEEAQDLDDLLAAHEKYLNSIVEKSLLGERSQHICKTLFVLFELILRFRSHADRLYERLHDLQAREGSKSRSRSKNERQRAGAWVGGRKAMSQVTGEFIRKMGEEMDGIADEYSLLLDGFIAQLPVQQHVDLKFLFFRLDFTEFYTRQQANASLKSLQARS
ncbi:LOW QUALITY PROTEIN: gamma-tubulin complex component 3 [Amborella trichopoda]|nr:LOW QUALITY PROTEIN: gamma-tubulin complex component 3 [Amborella trichopoda]|eukprot:XP_020526076.1 LOW QUALITY PROTEIN: gamma-tubulin complex component 3 [Amborella trichopoda]